MALAENPPLQLTGSQRHLWNEFEGIFPTEKDLTSAAVALGAGAIKPWSEQEIALVRGLQSLRPISKPTLTTLRDLILSGLDPLGEAFCTLRTPEDRRVDGATYIRPARLSAQWSIGQQRKRLRGA